MLRFDDDGAYLDDGWRKVGKVHALRADTGRTLCGLWPPDAGDVEEWKAADAAAVTCGRCRRSL